MSLLPPVADGDTILLNTSTLTGSMTAPVTGSCGEPAWTARVPNLWTGEGARGGVSIWCSATVMIADFKTRISRIQLEGVEGRSTAWGEFKQPNKAGRQKY